MTTTITATPVSDGDPAPYVELLGSAFDAGVVTVTMWRLVDGRSYRVRGMVNVSASGVVTGRDFEAPFDRLVTYRLEQFDTNGDFKSWSTAITITLVGPEGAFFWVHNPTDPESSMLLPLLQSDVAQIVRPLDAETFRVLGRSVPVALFQRRHGIEQLVLDTMTVTAVEASKFDALFGGYDDMTTLPIICVRAPVETRLPGTFYGLVPSPAQQLFDVHTGGEVARWVLTADEIAAPPAIIATALLDYADFTAYYADYAAFTAAYADYAEAQQDYSIAGTA